MASTKPQAADDAQAAEPSEFALPLDEFCAQLSRTDKRVELIAAFHAHERANGRMVDLPSTYTGRFAAFAAAPV